MSAFNIVLLSLFLCCFSINLKAQQKDFTSEVFPESKAWTNLNFYNNPDHFQFAIVSDRTGGLRPGIFAKAVEKLNLLMPEFVMSVGDFIQGYTQDSLEVNRQWDEFNQILSPLKMPFFYLPGNHDFTNDMMRNQWMERYGRDYYYFKYKNVLFITMNTSDEDETMFSEKQTDYVKRVLNENQDVRWTMIFMHHPAWSYRGNNNFTAIEEVLEGRKYTVFAGHTHRYMHSVRQNQNYYVLATTGGGSSLIGPKFGRFDHVTWVTMGDDGPQMLNLKLDGMIKHDVASEENTSLAQSLLSSTRIKSQVIINKKQENENTKAFEFSNVFAGGSAFFLVENTANKPLHFKGSFYHHHQVTPEILKFDTLIAPKSIFLKEIAISATKPFPYDGIDPLELSWTMGYEKELLEPAFELEGTFLLEINPDLKFIEITEDDIFLDNLEVSIKNPFDQLAAHYTLDGSMPSQKSPRLINPVQITKSTTINVRLFSSTEASSEVLTKEFKKVMLKKSVKAKRSKAGLSYQYYEGKFKNLPDFSTLSAKNKGIAKNLGIDVLSGDREDHFAFLFEGYIEVPETGIYTFYLYSDDGSRLLIGDEKVIDNDGSHEAQLKTGMIALQKGKHPIRLEYFEDFEGEILRLGWEIPNANRRQNIPFTAFSH
ncbi:MAG: PA14 domain-containing protein [Bacteroidota bacterium]